MTMPLTALERDLLACVERLVTACVTSTVELHGLEVRSTSGIEIKVNGLAHCLALLMKSHLFSAATLADLLTEERSYATFQENMRASLKLAKAAEQQLKQN